MINSITPHELNEQLNKNLPLVLFDVRSLTEYRMGHIAQATSVPLDMILNDQSVFLEQITPYILSNTPLYFVCLSDYRSFVACETLQKANVNTTYFIKGGMKAWISQGFPIITETD